MSIPQDIVDEILSWLPEESLARFNLVCKDWYSNIHSASFKAKHLKNHPTKEPVNITQGIVDEILSRLPMKSLIRFKLVSKDWCSNIQSGSFIAQYLRNQTRREKVLGKTLTLFQRLFGLGNSIGVQPSLLKIALEAEDVG